jgi:antitoxin MazE
MITKIIQIGNSKGIRIPNQILKQMDVDDQMELVVDENKDEIILKPVRKVREGWSEAFKKMNKGGEDKLFIDDSIDLAEWDW